MNILKPLSTLAMLVLLVSVNANQTTTLPETLSISEINDFAKIFELKDVEIPELKVETKFSLGAGSTGGGQGSDGFLRDLQSGPEFVCESKMNTFVSNFPTFNKIIKKFSAINLGFTSQLVEEMKIINICMVNGEINSDLISNQDGILMSESQYDQLALRVMYNTKKGRAIDVYINRAEFESMNNELGQSFLLFHELMHSFVNTEPAISYINRLRGVVREVYQALDDNTWNLSDMNELANSYGMDYYKNPAGYVRVILGEEKLHSDLYSLVKRLLKQDNSSFSEEELKEIASNILFSANYEKIHGSKIVNLLEILEEKGLIYTGSVHENFEIMTVLDSAINNYNENVVSYIVAKNRFDKELLLPNKSFAFNKDVNSLYNDFINGKKSFDRNVIVFLWNNASSTTRRELSRSLRRSSNDKGSKGTRSLEILQMLSNK